MRDRAVTEINLPIKPENPKFSSKITRLLGKSVPLVLKQGWLKKQGGALGAYKDRWCVFTDDAILKYYDSEDAREENRKGKGDVSFKIIREYDQDGKNFHVTTDKKKWVFQAKDETEAGDWLHMLRKPMGDAILEAVRLKKKNPFEDSKITLPFSVHPIPSDRLDQALKSPKPEARRVHFSDQPKDVVKRAELVIAKENSRKDVEVPVLSWKNKIATEEDRNPSKVIEIEDDLADTPTPLPRCLSNRTATKCPSPTVSRQAARPFEPTTISKIFKTKKTVPSFVPSPVKPKCRDFCCGNASEVEARFLRLLPISVVIGLLDVVFDILVISKGWSRYEWQWFDSGTSWYRYDRQHQLILILALTCVFAISGLVGLYNAVVTNPTTMWFVKVASFLGMGSTAQALKIWIFGLNGRHHEVAESDIAIYESLKVSEQYFRAPISGLLQINLFFNDFGDNFLVYGFLELASTLLCVISFASGVTSRKAADTKYYLAWQLQLMMFFYVAFDYLLVLCIFFSGTHRLEAVPTNIASLLLMISVPAFFASMYSSSWREKRGLYGLQQALMSILSISPLFDIYYKHAEMGHNNFAFLCVWYRHILLGSSAVYRYGWSFPTFLDVVATDSNVPRIIFVFILVLVFLTICFTAVFFAAFCDTIKAAYLVSLGTKKELSGYGQSSKLKWRAFADSIGETFGRTPKVALAILSRYNKNKFPDRRDRAGYDEDLFLENELHSVANVTNVDFLCVKLGFYDQTFTNSSSKVLCEQILTLDTKNPHAWKRLAKLEMEKKNVRAARANFERCLEADPNDSVAQRGIYDLNDINFPDMIV